MSGAVCAKKPNIVLFLVDDMGWQDTSVPFDTTTSAFNKIYHTPSMELMASRGVKFTQAYATAISSPTRVSLMTGMDPASHRVSNWTLMKDQSQDQPSKVLTFPSWNFNGLQPVGTDINNTIQATTLPEILRANGYTTVHCGKAHFGAKDTPGENPLNLGFDVNIAGHAAGGLASYLSEVNYGNKPEDTKQNPFAIPGLEKYWGSGLFVTEALTREALLAVDSVRLATPEKPFYLYMSHYAVHAPFNADNRFHEKYVKAGLAPVEAKYASMIEGMDKSLGDIMDYLDRNNLSDNTIIVFMSDNGGLSACGRNGEKDRHNWPVRSGKGSSYEGGTRVPMIVVDPSTKRAGQSESTPVYITDFMPTILSMAGVRRYNTVQKVDGVSFLPLLQGKKVKNSSDRLLVWHFPCKWDCSGEGIGSYSAARKGDYKYIYFYDTGKSELYDLSRDLSESNNLALDGRYESVRASMAAELTAYLKSVNAQLPSLKATGEQCSYPN